MCFPSRHESIKAHFSPSRAESELEFGDGIKVTSLLPRKPQTIDIDKPIQEQADIVDQESIEFQIHEKQKLRTRVTATY